MRPELELIQKIEQYLKGGLSITDKVSFEKQIANDPGLREEVRLQQEVMKGIERAGMKQKIQIAGRKFMLQNNFLKWGLGGLSILVVLVAALLYYNSKTSHHNAYEGKALPEYNEQGETNWADADRNISARTFLIDAAKDTVIETKGGIVMVVPANVFLDENGNPANGKIELAVKEALDPATMMNAGLSTKSGAGLLESGGMFFIDARKNGKALRIDPAKGISMEIPADSVKPGMQLFNGKRMPDGTIDWINPKPLEHGLVPVNIETLNFYPPHYLDSLQRWGYDIRNKKFTDSLYYSFARFFWRPDRSKKTDTTKAEAAMDEAVNAPKREYLNSKFQSDSVGQIVKDYAIDSLRGENNEAFYIPCGINPAKIKAIWNEKFQNTILATREFEERLQQIHLIGDPAILDLYVNNLDKSLSYIDSLAASGLGEGGQLWLKEFISFASRHDGKVQNGSNQFQLLKNYYQNKTRAFTEAMAKTQNEFWNKQSQLDNEADSKRSEHETDSNSRMNQNFSEEFTVNLKDAYRQLGYDTAIKPRMNTGIYSVLVTTTGWCNVDRYVYESTVNRSSLNYTDPGTGKKAVINYLPVSFGVEQWNEYDRLYVYLLPDKLSSFMRLTGSGGKYSEKLDELMQYKLVCLAYKDEQAYFYSMEAVQPKDYSNIALMPIEKNELDKKLNSAGTASQASAIVKENEFFQFEIVDQKRQKHNLALLELVRRTMKLIFPCYSDIGSAK
jgi:hypothetical protein